MKRLLVVSLCLAVIISSGCVKEHRMELEPITEIDNRLQRLTPGAATYAATKTQYEDAGQCVFSSSESETKDLYASWWAFHGVAPEFDIRGNQGYASYNTSSVESVSSAKFKIAFDRVRLTAPMGGGDPVPDNPILQIYKHDWGDTLEAGDWTGGVKIAERELTPADEGTEIEIDISPSDVNAGGYSRYRFTLKHLMDLNYWDEPPVEENREHWIRATTAKLVITEAAAPTAPTALRCNGQTNPTDVIPSYFSAIYNDPNLTDVADYYRLQVNKESDFSGRMLWDSAKTAMNDVNEGSRCANITYDGQALSSNKIKYYWRIKFWDSGGLEGVWSAAANFTLPGSGAGEGGALPWEEDVLEPTGIASVEIPRRSGEWTPLGDIMRIHTQVNKNPLDAIQIAQAEVLCSNIDKDFNSFEEAGAWYKQLEGFAIQISAGCSLSGIPISHKLFTGIISSVHADRITQTAEIKVVDFLDYFGRVTIEETPIWENISLTTLYKNLVELAFSEWVEGVDYFVEDLGGSTIPAIGYENLNLLSELKKIAECRGMILFTDVNGKLVCRSRSLEGDPWTIKYNYNLETAKEQRHIDDIINWVLVHARPHELVYEPTSETPETVVPAVPDAPVLGPDITPPGKISGFTATPSDKRIDLTWNNPLDPDLSGVYIRYGLSGYPTHPTSTIALCRTEAESYAHKNRTNGRRYYYSAFCKDTSRNWSGAAHASAIAGAAEEPEVDVTDTSPVSAFRAEPGSERIILTWRNPQIANFSKVVIRHSTTSYPTGPTKGVGGFESTAQTCTHVGLTNGTRYYYSLFVQNTAGYYSGAEFASAIPAGTRKVLSKRTISGGGCLRSQEGIPAGWTEYLGCFYSGTDGFHKTALSFSPGGRSEGWLKFRHKWEISVTLPYFHVKRQVGLNDDLSLSFSHSLAGLAKVTVTKITATRGGLRVEYKLVYTGPRGIRWDFRNELMLRG